MARITRVNGVEEVLRQLGESGARQLAAQIDVEVEKAARKMANEAATNAPRKTGKLAGSIPPSVAQESEMTWVFGSDVEYATRQEYEHSTQKGFFRKAVWNNRSNLREGVREVIRRHES